jgi:hypothetical protein
MTSIEITKITYSDNKIQECQLVISSKSFTVSYQNNQYEVSPGEGGDQQKNDTTSATSASTASNPATSASTASNPATSASNPASTATSASSESNIEGQLSQQLKKKEENSDIEAQLAQNLK